MKRADQPNIDDEVSYLMKQMQFDQYGRKIYEIPGKSAYQQQAVAGEQTVGFEALNRTMAERQQETSAVYLHLKDQTIKMLMKQLEGTQIENSNIFDKYQSVQALNYYLEHELAALKEQNERFSYLEYISADYQHLQDENQRIRDQAAKVVQIVSQQQEELAELRNNMSSQLYLKKYQGLIERLQIENQRYKEIFDSLAITTYADEISRQQQQTRRLEESNAGLYESLAKLEHEHAEALAQLYNDRNAEVERLHALHAAELTDYLARLQEGVASSTKYFTDQITFLYTYLGEERKSHERDNKLFATTRYYLGDLYYSATQQQAKAQAAILKAKQRYNVLADYLEHVLQLNGEQKSTIDALQAYSQEMKLKAVEYQAEIASLKQINSNLSCGSFGVLNYDAEIKRILDEIQEQSRAEVRRILAETESAAIIGLNRPEIPVSADTYEDYSSEGQAALQDEAEQDKDNLEPES